MLNIYPKFLRIAPWTPRLWTLRVESLLTGLHDRQPNLKLLCVQAFGACPVGCVGITVWVCGMGVALAAHPWFHWELLKGRVPSRQHVCRLGHLLLEFAHALKRQLPHPQGYQQQHQLGSQP